MSSVYSSYIKRMRMCSNGNCKGCTYAYEGLTNTEECKEDLMHDAAEQLEEADKCNAKLVKKCKEMEQRIAELIEAVANRDRLADDMNKYIGKLEAQIQKWVSAEDHLPEESGEYIVYIQMGTGVEVPDFMGSNDLSYVTSMYFKKGQKIWLDEYDEAYNADLSLVDTVNEFHVTHWMPLPQKPKGEQE